MKTIEAQKRSLSYKIESAETELAKFKERLASNPAYAFEWGNSAVEAAANIEIFGSLVAWLERGEKNVGTEAEGDEGDGKVTEQNIIDAVVKEARREVLRRSRYVPSSTSQMSNLVEHYKLAAWATALEQLEGRF